MSELADQGYTKTVSYTKTIIHGALKQTVREYIIMNNPAEYVCCLKKVSKNDDCKVERLEVLSKEQQSIFIEAVKGE